MAWWGSPCALLWLRPACAPDSSRNVISPAVSWWLRCREGWWWWCGWCPLLAGAITWPLKRNPPPAPSIVNSGGPATTAEAIERRYTPPRNSQTAALSWFLKSFDHCSQNSVSCQVTYAYFYKAESTHVHSESATDACAGRVEPRSPVQGIME